VINPVLAQDKTPLDLETAILKGRSKLAPEDIAGISWISNDLFTASGSDGVLRIRNSKGEAVDSITVDEVNQKMLELGQDSLKYLRPDAWKDSNLFYFIHQRGVFSFNRDDRSLVKISHHPEKAENLELSRSTGRLAYTIGNDVYVSTLIDPKIPVTNHGDSEVRAGIAIHRSEFGITKGLFWSEDGTKLGFYEMDESAVSTYPLASYNTIPGKAEPLKYPMAGQSSQKARVGIYHVEENKTVYLNTGPPSENYLTNFKFLPVPSLACVVHVNRDQNEASLKVYNTITGKLDKELFKESHEKYVEPEEPPVFLPNGDFLWLSERDGFNHLYLYDAEGNLKKQISKGPFEVQRLIGTYNNGKSVIFTASEGLMNSTIYSASIPGGNLDKLDPRQGTFRVYGSDNSNLIIKYSSIEVANDVSIVTPQGKKLATLLNVENAPFEEYEIGEITFPVITAADSTPLQGRLIKPFDFDSTKTYPVLVYVYGGPHVQLIQNNYHGSAAFWMFYAANMGYLVFTIDGRGSSGRGLEFEQATFRNLGETELQDQLAGVDYLAGLSFADTSRMAIHGWSYGGYMTTSMMLKYPQIFDVGVAGGPVTDWHLYEVMYTERYMDTPVQNPEGYKRADLKNYAKELRGDLLLIHGLDDDVVVPQHSYNLLEAFIDSGKEVDFFVYPGHKHNVRGKDRVHLMYKVLNYIDTHLDLGD
jgi:dipeptidyl-peptidase-4